MKNSNTPAAYLTALNCPELAKLSKVALENAIRCQKLSALKGNSRAAYKAWLGASVCWHRASNSPRHFEGEAKAARKAERKAASL